MSYLHIRFGDGTEKPPYVFRGTKEECQEELKRMRTHYHITAKTLINGNIQATATGERWNKG